MPNHFRFLIVLSFLCIVFVGCSKKDTATYKENTITSAQNKLIEIARDEYETNIVTKSIGSTMWIYIPLEESIIDIKATGSGVTKKEDSELPLEIRFLDGKYKDNTFDIAYDIGRTRKYNVSYGYGTTYPPKVQDLQRSILTAISRAYGDAQIDPDNSLQYLMPIATEREAAMIDNTVNAHFDKEPVPNFFVIIVADIVKGLDIKMTIAFSDLRRVMTDPSFTEEYSRRAIYEQPSGNIDIIHDKEGKYIDYTPLTWAQFIARQIAYRVQYTYSQSSKEPPEDIETEILRATNQSINAYSFQNFEQVVLRNLNDESENIFAKPTLKDYAPEEVEPKGKLHHIKFR